MVVLVQQSEVYQLSNKSTPAVPDSFFHVTEFMLGAGIVVVGDGAERWFLPKGRKDKGESLDKTALREGYEEIAPLPLYSGSIAPDAPTDQGVQIGDQTHSPAGQHWRGYRRAQSDQKDTEPTAVTIQNWDYTAVFSRGGNVEYLTLWYVGQISEGADPEIGTGMEFEENFRSYLFTFEALEKITVEVDRHVLDTACRRRGR